LHFVYIHSKIIQIADAVLPQRRGTHFLMTIRKHKKSIWVSV